MNAYYTFYTTNIHVQSLHYEFISNHLIIIAQILELKKKPGSITISNIDRFEKKVAFLSSPTRFP